MEKSLLTRVGPLKVLALIVVLCGGAIIAAMRTTSTTFDEIVLMAGGARGFVTGRFDLEPDHPPLMQYVYGLPIFLARPNYPHEPGVPGAGAVESGYAYMYGRAFFWGAANDAERLVFLGRLPAALCAMVLVGLVYVVTEPVGGPGAGLLAAALVGFLPDVLAHGGVAYTDLPLTLAFLAALWLIDAAARDAHPRTAAAAGVMTGIALGVKVSALAIAPAALLLVAIEAPTRREDAAWRKRVVPAAMIALAAAYLTLVLVFRGDFLLAEFRYGLDFRYREASGGHDADNYLLGEKSPTGWWYFFPVAFLFKTSAGLHVLMAIALVAGIQALRRDPWGALRSRLRAPVVGILVFGAALLSSSLNIGFRYALPVLPLLCILTAAGVARFWAGTSRGMRLALVAVVVWTIAFPLSYFPRFLSFISEYGPGRDRNYTVLADSSLDWGQGLIELREFMREQSIQRVYLSYFGSALPAGYGIDYVPMPSFFSLPPPPAEAEAPEPEYLVISATNLTGAYLPGDPFAAYRRVRPAYVVANTLYVYRLRAQLGPG